MVRTPCIGVCSTTFGDLVCRGCKRYVHEIVDWNGYADDERQRVVSRLQDLRDGAVSAHLEITDPVRVRELATRFGLSGGESDFGRAYQLLRYYARGEHGADELGVQPRNRINAACGALFDLIERDFLLRSQARFEHDHKIRIGS